MWRLTRKNLAARKFRLFSTAFAIMLGVAFMAGTLVLSDTIGKTFDDLFADIYEDTDAYVRQSSDFEAFGQEVRGRVDASLVDTVAAVDGVEIAEGTTNVSAVLLGKDGKPVIDQEGPPALGFDWSDIDELNPFSLIDGTRPEGADQIVIDKNSADEGDVVVGDQVSVLTSQGPRPYTVAGIAKFGDSDSPGGASVVMFDREEAQQLAEPGKYDGVSVVADDGISEQEMASRISQALPSGVEAITGTQLSDENTDAIQDALSFINIFLLIFAFIALFVGAFVIYNTFGILVAQRTKETALLRSIGAGRRQILSSVIAESVVVGLIAAVVGLFMGIGIAVGLKALLAGFGLDIPAGGLVIKSSTVIVSVVVGVVITVLSAALPARRASKISPMEAFREVGVDRSATSIRRLVSGLIVTGIGVGSLIVGLGGELSMVGVGVFFIFVGMFVLGPILARPLGRFIGAPLPWLKGTTGVMARNNAVRNPKRMSNAASVLMIGAGLVVFLTIVADSIKASIDKIVDDSFSGDLTITAPGFGAGIGYSPALATQIGELADVESVVGFRGGIAKIDGKGVYLGAADPDKFDDAFNLTVTEGSISALGANEIAIDDELMESKGWTLGQQIPAEFPDTGAKQLTIAAVYEEDQLFGNYMLGLPAFEANWPPSQQLDSQIVINAREGVNTDQLKTEVEEVAAPYGQPDVQNANDFKKEQSAQVDQLLALMTVLLALAIVIALFGIATTLALSIHERTHELGLLRAVGMSRKQLKSTVRWESVIMAVFGTALGLAVGVFFGWAVIQAIKDEGIDVLRIPVGQLVVVGIVAALAGVIAAIRPARRASKLNILEAISTE